MNTLTESVQFIPAAVVDLAMDNEWSAARAWREHMELIQSDVARRMGIT